VLSDIEIARSAALRQIADVARELGIPAEHVAPYGQHKAKISLALLERLAQRPQGKLVLVTGITPTPAGEGKSTVTVGLGDGLRRLGRQAVICLREPSLGPCFGIKGGAAGGGFSQIVPMEDINLHFTGDIHAVGTAHNLLAAMLDNHLQQGNPLGLDTRRISWPRVMDMNDRALRNVVLGLGGPAQGMPRESGFDITAASEVMAVLCLAADLPDLQARLARIVVGETAGERRPVTAGELKADGAMTVLLQEALQPNLVQTLEGTPALVHGGPFANIAHGCNSLLATRLGLQRGEIVVTEAGFGADLGAEKFFDIKCRAGGLRPDAAVVVATVRAMKYHGGVPQDRLGEENVEALRAGAVNLRQHIENVSSYGVPVVVALNRFGGDSDAELAAAQACCAEWGVPVALSEGFARGGEGMTALGQQVLDVLAEGKADFKPLYENALSLKEKIERVATAIYRADGVDFSAAAARDLGRLEDWGHGALPVCMAKTQYSFSTDPARLGTPRGFTVPVRGVRLSAGAGFVVALTGDIMTMPGLPRRPAAEQIGLDAQGRTVGLF
jgi:formate--tetrahydrofolate ligase